MTNANLHARWRAAGCWQKPPAPLPPIPVKVEPPPDLVQSLRQWWTEAYGHQSQGLAELVVNPRYLLAWEMGTGKSAVIARRLLGSDAFGKWFTVIACPKSVLYVWERELLKHAGIACVVVEGSPNMRRRQILDARRLKVPAVINYELLATHEETIKACYPDCVVADECHRVKNLTTGASRSLRRISHSATHRYALSGTPAPNSPLDIFGTLTFLDPAILGTPYITHLRARYARYDPNVPYKVKEYLNLDDLERRTQAVSSRVTKDDCLDLPPKLFESRYCELTPEQARVYKDLKQHALARLLTADRAGELSIENILSESLRLLQVVGGYVPDDDGHTHALPSAKIAVLDDLVEEIGDRPTIIWAPFVAEVHDIGRRLGDRAVVHTGSLSGSDRREAIRRFCDGEVQFLVSTPSSAREGLTLTRASVAVYYGRTFNLLDWLQTQDRPHRIGQTRPVTIVSILARGTIDERVARALETKTSLQELLLGGESYQNLL